jgi:asparagine synthase (glutamine-hydrolysing)
LEIRRQLEESINLHLISDAPLGVFLSGGLDSSAIATIAAELRRKGCRITQNDKNLITLSIIFDEPEFSEQKYQQLVAQKIKSDHREVKITKKDFFDSFDEVFEAMDQPTIDGVNTFFIAKAAKEAGLKTVLSGLGADEIFLGYPHFKRAGLLRGIQKLPRFLRLPLELGDLFGDRCGKLSYFTNNDILSFYLGIRGLFSPPEVARILGANLSEVGKFINNFLFSQSGYVHSAALRLSGHGAERSEASEGAAPAKPHAGRLSGSENMSVLASLHSVDLLSYLELKFYLQNQLLKDTDFMSMHHSIEVRVPFLDHKLIEYISSLSPEIKIKRGVNKPLLVEAVRDILPQEIFTRPKMGFTFPLQKWLTETDSDFAGGHWSRFWAKKVLDKF